MSLPLRNDVSQSFRRPTALRDRVFGHATARVEAAVLGLIAPGADGPMRSVQDEEMAEMVQQFSMPLAVLSGYAEALGTTEAAGLTPDQRLDVSRIQASCHQARSQMDGLLTITRLQHDGPRAARVQVDPCETLNAAVRRATPILRDKRLAFGAASHDLPSARLDSEAVGAVLDNLVAALVPRVPCGAAIWASLQREPSDLALRVTVGVPEDEVTEIGFDMQDPIPRRADHRCGLPFLIASRIVELLGGQLAVEEMPGARRSWCARFPA